MSELHRLVHAILGILAPLIFASGCEPEQVVPTENDDYFENVVFERGAANGAYPVVRIPSLIVAPSGALLAFAEGRKALADDGDIDLVMRRSADGGASWSPVEVIVDFGADTAGNPAPVVDPDTGRIWLPYSTNPGADMMNRSVWMTYSDDDGISWAIPQDITGQIKPQNFTWYATGPGTSVKLRTGRLVVPCNHKDETGIGRSHVIYSDDGGMTWSLGGSAGDHTDESQIAELDDGSLVMNMRHESESFLRAVARSTDGGATFGPTTLDPNLPDPVCQGSIIASPWGLLFSNPATQVPFPRDHLTVRRSRDGGLSWDVSRELDPGPSAYSSLAVLPDGHIGVLWESGAAVPYDRIRFARFSIGWLEHVTP